MIRQPSLSTLIRSAIGALSIKIISEAETHVISDEDQSIQKELLLLQSKINAAPFERRTSPDVSDKIKAILKSVEITSAPDFIVFIGRKYPSLMVEVSKDPLMMHRIRHIYRVAEIGSCFSRESMSKLNRGIDDARKKVFEIDQRIGE